MIPGKLTLTPFVEGNEWEGIPQIVIEIGPDGGPYVAPDTSLATVTMRFLKTASETETIVELSSANNEIEILDAENWTFKVPRQVVPTLTEGVWDWQINCEDDSETGSPLTYFSDTIKVLKKI